MSLEEAAGLKDPMPKGSPVLAVMLLKGFVREAGAAFCPGGLITGAPSEGEVGTKGVAPNRSISAGRIEKKTTQSIPYTNVNLLVNLSNC